MSASEQLIHRGRQHLFANYRPPNFVLVSGRGSRVRSREGREFIDLITGIATCGLGHCHPKVSAAIKAQADQLWHVSNLYWNEPQIRAAERLTSTCFAERVFFCNSGSEANEGAIKLARRYHHDRRSGRFEIVTFEGSFHGRTLGSLAATAQPKYHLGFGPMPAGFRYLPYGDLDALAAAMGPHTAAVMLEPIQGEAGVLSPPPGFLAGVRALTREQGALMILDEVQSGVGRTGKMWAHQWEGVEPDIMTSAKALGNGFPVGALLATEEVARAFVPGTHATTFGGNAMACAAVDATLGVLLDDGVLEQGREAAAHLATRLDERLVGRGPVTGYRGKGMWLGLQVHSDARELAAAAAEADVLVNAIGDSIIRLAPALTISLAEIDEAIERLARAWN